MHYSVSSGVEFIPAFFIFLFFFLLSRHSSSIIFRRYDPSLTYGRVPRYAYRQFLPHYALFAQKCLRFKAYFRQGVFNSPDEHYRVRHVNIVYYLEDDTLCVLEPVVENAGLQQGKLVRRGRIPKNAKGDPFIWKDFNVGIDMRTLSRKVWEKTRAKI